MCTLSLPEDAQSSDVSAFKQELNSCWTTSQINCQRVQQDHHEQHLIMSEEDIIKLNDRFSVIFGRPNFENYFDYLIRLYPNEKAGVFCCGSRQIKKDIRHLCKQLNNNNSDNDNNSTRFSYHEEDF